MKRKLFAERGQALIIIAFAAIGIFAVIGLVIDGSAKYSDRRHAQNAADTAAMTGALSLARDGVGGPWSLQALDRASANGYGDIAHSTVHVYSPPQSGIYANCYDVHFDCHNYVQVIIDSHLDTWFARIVGIMQTHNHVEAVASKITAINNFNFGGNSVVALSPTGCALMTQGNANVTIKGGGLFTNSDDASCSYKKDSCAGTVDIDSNYTGTQGAVTMVGGYSVNTGCLPQADLAPASSKQIPFPPPYQELPEPAECSLAVTTVSGNPTSVTLNPGHYAAIPPKNNMKDVILNPGVYCIDTTLKFNSGETLTVSPGVSAFPPPPSPPSSAAPGVFLYFKPGGSFTFNGGSTVTIWGIHDTGSQYNGYLMYLAPNYSSTPVNCTINGNTGDKLWGAIFGPYCNFTLDGTSDPTGFMTQIIGYNVKFAGGSNVTLTYDASQMPVWTIPLQVGLSK